MIRLFGFDKIIIRNLLEIAKGGRFCPAARKKSCACAYGTATAGATVATSIPKASGKKYKPNPMMIPDTISEMTQ